jgi:hypothetical protein
MYQIIIVKIKYHMTAHGHKSSEIPTTQDAELALVVPQDTAVEKSKPLKNIGKTKYSKVVVVPAAAASKPTRDGDLPSTVPTKGWETAGVQIRHAPTQS